jgi:hypothetical protein
MDRGTAKEGQEIERFPDRQISAKGTEKAQVEALASCVMPAVDELVPRHF